MEIPDLVCLVGFAWNDGPEFHGEEGVWAQKVRVLTEGEDGYLPPRVNFDFRNLNDFRSTMHVEGDFGRQIVTMRHIGGMLQVWFTAPDDRQQVFDRIIPL